jgi:aminoglycoside phosphotransferase (APT) family kinase protein
LHGDPHPLNLVVRDGQLAAVIDFGDLCAGDPASDLSAAWIVIPTDARDAFRDA